MINGTVHLIRHSTTTGIEQHWMYGSTDLPLSESGYALLDELKGQGVYPSAAGCDFVTSGMLRANQTLREIYGDVPFGVEPAMREMSLGIYECKNHEELKRDPRYIACMHDVTGMTAAPGGECLYDFSARVTNGFDALISRAQRDLILVCHGGTIGAIMYRFRSPAPPLPFFTYLPEPARGYTLTIRNGNIADAREI